MIQKHLSETVSQAEKDQAERAFEVQLTDTLGKLLPRWQGHHKVSLELRYETGRELNSLYNLSPTRQVYGAGVLKKISAELGVSRAEVSRMRQFASAVPDLADFLHDHPEHSTWTKVKLYLPTANGKPNSGTIPKAVSCKRIRRSIHQLTTVFQQAAKPTEEQRSQLLDDFQKMEAAFRVALGDAILPEPGRMNSSLTGAQPVEVAA